MKAELDELARMQTRLTEIKALVEKCLKEQEVYGFHDNELLAECLALLEFVTYHDGRYGQADSVKKFQNPARRLVFRLAARLNIAPYQQYR